MTDRVAPADLAAFLLACYAEDEEVATDVHTSNCSSSWWEHDRIAYGADECDCSVPARVLAECAAKRAVVELHTGTHECSSGGDNCAWIDEHSMAGAMCDTLRLLALPYADCEGYDQAWRPEETG